MTVSKIFYWKEGRLNASLNRDRDGQQTVVEILSKFSNFSPDTDTVEEEGRDSAWELRRQERDLTSN